MNKKALAVSWYNLGTVTLLFVGNVILLSSIALLIGIPIQAFLTIASGLFTFVEIKVLFQFSYKDLAKVAAAWLALFLLGLFFCVVVYDTSWDGNAYHKVAIGCLKQGWNPIYETINSFIQRNPIPGLQAFNVTNWVEHFPKATWLFGACIYALTQNIETAKVINIMLLFSVGSYAYYFLQVTVFPKGVLRKKDKILCIGFSVICMVNPIAINQIATFYVDGALASGITLLILILLALSISESEYQKKQNWLWLFYIVLFLCNLKFTSLGITAVFCAAVYLVWLGNEIVRDRKKAKDPKFVKIKKATLFYIFTVFCSVCIVGSSSYMKNIVVGGHPFYPIMGAKATINETDLMAGYLPENVDNTSALEKWALVFFSHTESGRGDTPIKLKVPFTFTKNELRITAVDTERGGFGFWFSGVFLICVLISAAFIVQMFASKKCYEAAVYLSILIAIFLLVAVVSASWLARYSPYLYLPIVLAVYMLIACSQSRAKLIVIAISMMVLINSATFIWYPLIQYKQSAGIRAQIEQLKETGKAVKVSTVMYGPLFNLNDNEIEYQYFDELSQSSGAIGVWGLSYQVN